MVGGVIWRNITRSKASYLSDLGMCTAAVSRCGVHPSSAFGQLQRLVGVSSAGALLPEGALLVLDAPAAFEPWVGFQAHTAAVPQRPALVQVGCVERVGERDKHDMIKSRENSEGDGWSSD